MPGIVLVKQQIQTHTDANIHPQSSQGKKQFMKDKLGKPFDKYVHISTGFTNKHSN